MIDVGWVVGYGVSGFEPLGVRSYGIYDHWVDLLGIVVSILVSFYFVFIIFQK